MDQGWTPEDEAEFQRTHPRPPTTSDEELLEAETAAIAAALIALKSLVH